MVIALGVIIFLLIAVTYSAMKKEDEHKKLKTEYDKLRGNAANLWDENKQLKTKLGAVSEMEFSQMEAKRLEAVAESTKHRAVIDQKKSEINPYLVENEALKVQVKELKKGIQENKDAYVSSIKKSINENELIRLTDVCETIIADQKITDLEIEHLQKWLNENSLHDNFCIYLSAQIKDILRDGKITPTERRKLFNTLEEGIYCYSHNVEFDPPQPKTIKKRTAKKDPLNEAKTLEFTYEDSKGNITVRQVSSFYTDGIYLKGFCHKANAVRTFIIDRICGSVVDVDTGEVFNP